MEIPESLENLSPVSSAFIAELEQIFANCDHLISVECSRRKAPETV